MQLIRDPGQGGGRRCDFLHSRQLLLGDERDMMRAFIRLLGNVGHLRYGSGYFFAAGLHLLRRRGQFLNLLG